MSHILPDEAWCIVRGKVKILITEKATYAFAVQNIFLADMTLQSSFLQVHPSYWAASKQRLAFSTFASAHNFNIDRHKAVLNVKLKD